MNEQKYIRKMRILKLKYAFSFINQILDRKPIKEELISGIF